MPFFNFIPIAPAAPNDPTVDPIVQLNANWDYVDEIMSPYLNGEQPPGMEVGQEWFDGTRFNVWDGVAPRVPDSIEAGWDSYHTLRILSPRLARVGFVPKWRVNTSLRLVELSGCVIHNSTADPWPDSLVQISATGTGEIPGMYAPIGGLTVFSQAAGLPTSPYNMSGVYVTVDHHPTADNCIINGYYLGQGGGDFCSLDGMRWWY